MARLAVPYELYGYLRQRRAIGKQDTPRERRLMYQAYLDTLAGRQAESERLALERQNMQSLAEYRQNLLDMQKEALAREESAARIKGLVSLGEFGYKGYKALQGTALGAKLGISAAKPLATAATKAATAGAAGAQAQIATTAAKAVPTKTAAATAAETAGEGAATATAGGTATSTLMSSVIQPAGLGMLAGNVTGMLPIPTEAKQALGAAAGAALGFIAAGPIGGIIGAITGLFSGGCIIITACTDKDSYEVNIARMYRDNYLDAQTLRGYYMIAEKLVPLMNRSKTIKKAVKKHLVDHLIAYGEYVFGYKKSVKLRSRLITKAFLKACSIMGSRAPVFIRSNGEVF